MSIRGRGFSGSRSRFFSKGNEVLSGIENEGKEFPKLARSDSFVLRRHENAVFGFFNPRVGSARIFRHKGREAGYKLIVDAFDSQRKHSFRCMRNKSSEIVLLGLTEGGLHVKIYKPPFGWVAPLDAGIVRGC